MRPPLLPNLDSPLVRFEANSQTMPMSAKYKYGAGRCLISDAGHFQRQVGVSATMARTTQTSLRAQGQQSAVPGSTEKRYDQRGKPEREALQQINAADGDDSQMGTSASASPLGFVRIAAEAARANRMRVPPLPVSMYRL